jgi:ubiquinone/menaquinone biosynthesis C-methylase UbiE
MSSDIREAVQAKYGALAASGLSSDHAGVHAVARAFGYSPEELAAIPAEANMGVSCGNPTAQASLRDGETVVDLGCGGGLDVFLAARRVGPGGKAIGIDMTREMIELARRNAAKAGVTNVEFHLATIDRMPLPDAAADCVISNCVINLAPDKARVFAEVARVLRPGGRLAIADIVSEQQLTESITCNADLWASCIGGAAQQDAYLSAMEAAGLRVDELRENPYHFISDQARNASEKYGVKSVSVRAMKE